MVSERITKIDEEYSSFKLLRKRNSVWVDATSQLTPHTASDNNNYPSIHAVNNVEYFLYYPLKIPIKNARITLWFGTNETDHTNIKFGVYSLDYEPILEYDRGVIEDSENWGVFYPDNLIAGEHWFINHFDDMEGVVKYQMKTGDGIDNELSHDLDDTSINTHQLGYVGIKIKGNSNANTWIEKVRLNYNKEGTSATITFDKNEFKLPELASGKIKVTTSFGDILDSNQFTFKCTQAVSGSSADYGSITQTVHNGNEHQFNIDELNASDEMYTLTVSYDGDETYDAFQTSNTFKMLERSGTLIEYDINPRTYYTPNYVPINARLIDELETPIPNASLKIHYKSTNSEEVHEYTRTTDNTGFMSSGLSLTPTITGSYEIWISYDGDENHAPTSTNHKIVRYVNRSKMIEKTGDGATATVKSPTTLSVKLTDWSGNPLSGRQVKYEVYINNKLEDGATLESMSTGLVQLDYTNYIKGDVDTRIEFIFEGNESEGLLGCTESFTVHWNKINTFWTIFDGERTEEVTRILVFQAKLNSDDSHTFSKIQVHRTITVTTLNGSSTNKINFVDTLGESIPSEDIRSTYVQLFSDGSGEFSAASMVGDEKATVTFEFEGDDLYKPSSITSPTLQWNKIETSISTSDIKIYSGRFTLFEDNPELDPSPGVDDDYMNFRADVTPINTSNNYTVDEGKVTWKGRTSSTVYMRVDVKNGQARGRATNSIPLSVVSTTILLSVVYEGSDKFKTSTKNIEYITYNRLDPKIKTTIDHPYNEPARYNIPFNWRTDLTEQNGNGINNQKIRYYLNGELKYTKTTNNQGLATVVEHVPKFVGTLRITSKFNEDDTVDKYLPKYTSNEFEIDKDSTTISSTTNNIYTTPCQNAEVIFTLRDSIERPLSNQPIKIYEDDGTANSPTWEYDNVILTTANNGSATYVSEAYSLLKLVLGKFEEMEYYYGSQKVQDVEYHISKTYTVNVNNGVATIPIDCDANTQKGICSGLYDVELEYIPPETENGQCPLYGASSKKEYIRKKKGTTLSNLTANLNTEPYLPLHITTELKDLLLNKLSNMEEMSYVNGFDESTPPHITDNLGQISRGGWVKSTTTPLKYYFISQQTKKYASADLEVTAKLNKITPTLDTDDLTGYSGVAMDLIADLYHEYKQYDEYGIEIKKDNNGSIIWHNPRNNTYYKEENGVGTLSNATEYNNAQSIITKIPLPNKKITWYGVDGKTELASATTNENGHAETTYSRVSVGVNTISVKTTSDKTYQAVTKPIQITTLARLPVYFEEIDFFEKDNQGNYIRAAIYHHPTTFYTRLYRDVDGVKTPFANQEIIFSKEVTWGSATTDENGYVEFTHVVDSTLKFPYQVYFYSLGKYQSTKQVYRVPVIKQTPILTLTSSNNNPKVGDKITLTAKLTEDVISGKTPLSSRGITFFDDDDGLEYHKTNNDGTCSMTYKLRHSGVHPLYAVYNTKNDAYNEVTGTLNLTVRKTNTYFEPKANNPLEIPGLTSDKVTVILKNALDEILQSKTVSIQYNGQTLTKKTNGEGEISLDTDKFEKDMTKTMVFSFAGDDDYNSSTFTQTIKWGDYLDEDNCDDLHTFDILTENYYASNGDSKWGIDPATGTYKNDKAIIPGTTSSPKCTRNGQTGTCLRSICNDLKTEGVYDAEEDSVSAPTGVVMRSKKLITSKHCTISFWFKIKYNGVNNEKVSSPNSLIGGHLGLMTDGTGEMIAEHAPARYEFFRQNAYFISEGNPNAKGCNYKKFTPNEEYYFEFKVNDKKIEGKVITPTGETITDTQTATCSFENLRPYCFAFTNGTSFVLKKLKITRDD